MYAIVEFLLGKNKEYTVVPVIWLDNNNTVCYWPRVKTTEELEKLVKENSSYEKKWPKYKVHRVLKSSENYDSLQLELTAILDQSTTDSDGNAIQATIITDKPPHEQKMDSERDAAPKKSHKNKSKNKDLKRKLERKNHKSKISRPTKSQLYPKNKRQSSSFSQSSGSDNKENDTVDEDEAEFTDTDKASKSKNSPRVAALSRSTTNLHLNRFEEKDADTVDEDEPTDNNNSSKSKNSHESLAFLRSITNVNLAKSPYLSQNTTYSEASGKMSSSASLRTIHSDCGRNAERLPQPSITSTPRSSSHKFRHMTQGDFQVEVLTRLRTYESELSQINTSLSQLARSAQLGNLQTAVRPDGFPTLPIETMEDFRSFDVLLKVEVFEIYFTNRLAAIGGSNVRQGVMNALKFALSNTVAMDFNWAGRDRKQPFRGTEMARIITAAVKIRYADSPDATDVQIFSAIKDWLKQAKHRHACQNKKNYKDLIHSI